MTPAQLSNLKEASPAIRVAIVRGPETTVLAGSLEKLLAEAKGFCRHGLKANFIERVRGRESRERSQQPFNTNQQERKIVCQHQK
jgi:hypothetical protein